MQHTLKGIVAGALALAGATLATAEAQAMPIQPLSPSVSSQSPIEPVYYYRYGYRRPFFGYRRFYRPYGFRRPFVYGYRPFYRVRPFYGYRRF